VGGSGQCGRHLWEMAVCDLPEAGRSIEGDNGGGGEGDGNGYGGGVTPTPDSGLTVPSQIFDGLA